MTNLYLSSYTHYTFFSEFLPPPIHVLTTQLRWVVLNAGLEMQTKKWKDTLNVQCLLQNMITTEGHWPIYDLVAVYFEFGTRAILN